MKVNSRIELEFAGITLPVIKDGEGRDIVPLKPISDVFGLSWEDQRRKITPKLNTCTGGNPGAGIEKQAFSDTCTPDNRGAGSSLGKRLGACIGVVPFSGQRREMLCIRLDRVATYLNCGIDPDRVRAAGNETGADFLEAKQEEWDDLIHEYETRQGGMLSAITGETRTKAINIRLYLSVLRAKRETNDEADRAALSTIAKDLASASGAPYQAELIE